MREFLIYSIIGSLVLTALINVLPWFFPKAMQKAEREIHKKIGESIERAEQQPGSRVNVFFPWKAMLIVALVLTVLVNVVGYFAGH